MIGRSRPVGPSLLCSALLVVVLHELLGRYRSLFDMSCNVVGIMQYDPETHNRGEMSHTNYKGGGGWPEVLEQVIAIVEATLKPIHRQQQAFWR